MRRETYEKISSVFVILNGLICIIFTDHIFKLLPTICGLVLLIKGTIKFIEGMKNKDYASLEGIDLERAILILAIGIGILIKQDDALFVVGVFWGLSGLLKAAESFNVAFYNIYNKERGFLIIVKAIIESVLSLLLIFDPFANAAHHIIILGIELIFEGLVDIYWKNKKCVRG